jgi:hypothetical protein
VPPTAAYDSIADWYENGFPAGGSAGCDPLGVGRALAGLLGRGSGICLDVGCGTGVQAVRLRELG